MRDTSALGGITSGALEMLGGGDAAAHQRRRKSGPSTCRATAAPVWPYSREAGFETDFQPEGGTDRYRLFRVAT